VPTIFDVPPGTIRSDMQSLREALDTEIPKKRDDNFLIATWNIRSFGGLTRKWTATGNDSPKRDLRGLLAIIEILSRFDVIAVQEVKGNLRALRDTLKVLGDDWGFLMTDVNIGNAGNDERFLFLFDRRRVKPSGLAAELVIPDEDLEHPLVGGMRKQFARTPYAVSFLRNQVTVILTTLHVLYGDNEKQREPELKAIAKWMCDWAQRSNKYHHNLLALGDFNIDRKGSPGYEAFTSSGLTIPNVLMNQPRTIFDDPGDSSDDNFYDQIAWFTQGKKKLIDLNLRNGGNFDFMPYVYSDQNLTRSSTSFRLSDHYPLWVEFGL